MSLKSRAIAIASNFPQNDNFGKLHAKQHNSDLESDLVRQVHIAR